MPKGAFIGVGEAARGVIKGYIGVNNAARRIKKGYIGVGGAARSVFDINPIYHGKATNLSQARSALVAVTVGNYAVFAGGTAGSSTYSAVVDAYNRSLTRSTPTALSSVRRYHESAPVGSYALIAGGSTSSTAITGAVDAYNTSLTRSSASALTPARDSYAGAKVGSYALFAGGYVNASTYSAVVNTYNTTLARGTATALGEAKISLHGASSQNHAVFVGGFNVDETSNMADAYDVNLARSTPSGYKYYGFAAATFGEYAVFAGGTGSSSFPNYTTTTAVCGYNKSLSRRTFGYMRKERRNPAATAVGGYLLIAGGTGPLVDVDAYDSNLVRIAAPDLSIGRAGHAAATVGNYALFAGGSDGSITASVEAYTYIN